MKKKNEGASIILALMYLLICSVLCIVIISSSGVYVGRTNEKKKQDISSYLAVSTLKLFANEIEGKVIEYEDEGEIFLKRSLELNGIDSISGPLSQMIVSNVEGSGVNEKHIEINSETKGFRINATVKLGEDYVISVVIDEIYDDEEKMILSSCDRIVFYPLEYRENKIGKSVWIKYGRGDT